MAVYNHQQNLQISWGNLVTSSISRLQGIVGLVNRTNKQLEEYENKLKEYQGKYDHSFKSDKPKRLKYEG